MCEAVKCIPVELREGTLIAFPVLGRGDLVETGEGRAGNASSLAQLMAVEHGNRSRKRP